MVFFALLLLGVSAYAQQATVLHTLTISLLSCPPLSGPQCVQPGTLKVNGVEYAAGRDIYIPDGDTVSLQAIPSSGYMFTGWNAASGITSANASVSLTVKRPVLIAPQFKGASTVPITVFTEPPGLRVLADGVELKAPATLKWAWNSDHTLSAPSPQRDSEGNYWVFQDWSDGKPSTHMVQVLNGAFPPEHIARFVRAMPVELSTRPAGLKLKIDNGQECTACNFVWPVGSSHMISATDQTDENNLSYRFRGWGQGGIAPYPIAIGKEELAQRIIRLQALFDRLGLVTVESLPPGIRMKVGGGECATPCQVHKPLGTAVAIQAPLTHATPVGTRLDFKEWPDEQAPASRTVTAALEPRVLTAGYKSMNPLNATVSDPAGASLRFVPESADGYYDANSHVSVEVLPRPGYRFHHWEGDAKGMSGSVALGMGAPRRIAAYVYPAPYLPGESVSNAAGGVRGGEVAPCSLISITGLNLSAVTEKSPENELWPELGGVTVRIGDSPLPLYFVSPETNYRAASLQPRRRHADVDCQAAGPARRNHFVPGGPHRAGSVLRHERGRNACRGEPRGWHVHYGQEAGTAGRGGHGVRHRLRPVSDQPAGWRGGQGRAGFRGRGPRGVPGWGKRGCAAVHRRHRAPRPDSRPFPHSGRRERRYYGQSPHQRPGEQRGHHRRAGGVTGQLKPPRRA